MAQIRIGFIGYGGIGRVHALAYRAIPFYYGLPADSIQLAAVATRRAETAKQAAAEIGCDVFTGNYRHLLARDDIDAVDICTPNHVHQEIALAAAKAGKHIYCEKPMAMNAAQAQNMTQAVETAGVKAQMTFNFRFFPAITRAKQLMEGGFVGKVFSFRGRYHRSSYISADKPLSWRLQREMTGGGALFDLGSHILDLLVYLLGDFASVYGTLETFIKERPIAPGSQEKAPVDVDDIALLHTRLPDGSLGTVEISRMGTGATNDLIVEIFGDKGAIRFDLNEPAWLYVYDTRDDDKPTGGQRGFRKIEAVQRYDGQRAPDWTMTPDFVRTHAECQYQFIRSIWEDRTPSPSFADGLHVQKIMEAAQRSAQSGRWIQLAAV